MEIPTEEQRLKTYKKLLKKYSNSSNKCALCFDLVLSIGLGHSDYKLATKYFPEFGEYYNSHINAPHSIGKPRRYKDMYSLDGNNNPWRVKILTEIIQSMEKPKP